MLATSVLTYSYLFGFEIGVLCQTFTNIAERMRNYHEAGEEVLQLPSSKVPVEVIRRFENVAGVKIAWGDVPGTLQQALLWDSGFIQTTDMGIVQIFALCGHSMDEIQLTIKEYTQACSSQRNVLLCGKFKRQQECHGPNLLPIVKCATDSTTKTHFHSSMYVESGSDSSIPRPLLTLQQYKDWYLYGIHFQHEPNWGECPKNIEHSEPVIPCRPFAEDMNQSRWCRPEYTDKMNQWLEQWVEANSHKPKLSLPESLSLGLGCAFGVGVLVVFLFIHLRRRRRKLLIPSETLATTSIDYSNRYDEGLRFPQSDYASYSASTDHLRLSRVDILPGEGLMGNSNDKIIDMNQIELLQSIGKGSSGEVMLAKFSGAKIALKKVHACTSSSEQTLFEREIEWVKTLHHPNIIQFIGLAFSPQQGMCLMLEYMERGDLLTVLQNSDCKLSWSEPKLQIAQNCIAGLLYLHEFSPPIIHRDLKSRNVLIGRSFEAKLADFGLTRRVESLTMTMAGSALWCSPEICRGERYTEKSDIFSFGILLSELDTHELPYSHVKTPQGNPVLPFSIMYRVANMGLRPELSQACPAKIAELAAVCTHDNPAARPGARDILTILVTMQSSDLELLPV